MFGDYCDENDLDMAPVRIWVEKKNNRIAYSPTEKNEKELGPRGKMRDIVNVYRRQGKIKIIAKKEVEAKLKDLKKKRIKSNDLHIIALAQASRATLLVTKDANLKSHFKNRDLIKNGKIYDRKKNKKLLEKHRCP